MKSILALTLTTGLLTSAAPGTPTPHYCPATVLMDYTLGFSYYAQLQRDASCLPGDVTRIRKTSTLSQVKNGAPYQPIFPLKGAWVIDDLGANTVPHGMQWTLTTWKWQYYDGHVWKNAVTQ